MKIRKILSGLKAKYLPGKERLVEKRIFGKMLKVIDGTLRKADYDDAWFCHLAKDCSVFFDIGSNIGQTSLLANSIGKIDRIILVDPNPEALVYASKNLILNNLATNCNFYSAFVGDINGDSVKFYTVGVGSAGSVFASHAETARLINNFYYVETITMDYLVAYYKVIPDLVKIDVEGAEVMVLNGAKSLARNNTTRFMIEMHVTREVSMESNVDSVLEWAREVGYTAYFLFNGAEIKQGSELSHRGRCHILVQPSSWSYPEFLLGVKESSPIPEG